MVKRKSLSKKTRFEVFKRDRFACQYCGRTPPAVTLEVDHVIAVANGGDNHATNLVTSCFDCNSGKKDRPLADVPPPLAEHAARERERLEQMRAYNDLLMEIREVEGGAIRRAGLYWFTNLGMDGYVFGTAREGSIRIFLKRLPEAVILEAIDIAFARRPPGRQYDEPTWKYFCGVCWSKIREIEDANAERF